MREDAAERSAKYIETTFEALSRLKTRKLPLQVSQEEVSKVLDMVRGYMKDAEHYAGSKKPVTSLACIAYAEGLLDALSCLELVDI